MNEIIFYVLTAIVAAGIGIAIGRYLFKRVLDKMQIEAKEKASLILKEAEVTAENIKKDKILEAKEKFLKLKSDFEDEATKKKNQILTNENKLKQKEQNIAKQIEQVKRKEAELESMKENLAAQIEIINKRKEEMEKVKARLERMGRKL